MTNPRHSREDGASLIIVLILVTVIASVMSVILSQADTSVRATLALQDQAANNYGTDGAAQAVLNDLRASAINCADPTNPADVTLGTVTSPFYTPTSSQDGPLNASAKCTADAINGKVVTTSQPPPVTSTVTSIPAPITSTATALGDGDPTLPSYALLTTGTAAGDFGIDFSDSAGNSTVCVQNGSVASNSNIDVSGAGQVLAVRLDPAVSQSGNYTDCTSGTGSVPGSKLIVTAANANSANTGCLGTATSFRPTPCTAAAPSVPTPPAPPLPAITATDPAPVCTTTGNGGNATTYAALLPGRYTSVTALNKPCNTTSKTVVEWLTPGAYYLDFGSAQWAWPNKLIGGTPITGSGQAVAGLDLTQPSTLSGLSTAAAAPNACADPSGLTAENGVELIFGGASTVAANSSGTAELCASTPAGTPPVAIYGLAQSATVPGPGGTSVTIPAESLCSSSGCAQTSLIQTDPNGQPEVYFKGYVYAPNAQMYLTLKNSPGQVFNWGIVVRDFRLFVNGVSPSQAFISLPKPNTGVGVVVTTSTPPPVTTTNTVTPPVVISTTYTIRYINVWTCTVASLQQSGATKCPATGDPNVQVRVLTNSSGQPVKVLSWSQIR